MSAPRFRWRTVLSEPLVQFVIAGAVLLGAQRSLSPADRGARVGIADLVRRGRQVDSALV